MYPNPQDVLPLPPSPDIAQYSRLAKELAKACRSDDADAIGRWCVRFVERLHELNGLSSDTATIVRRSGQLDVYARERLKRAECALTQAQFVIARAHGFASWPRLTEHVDRLLRGDLPFERAADAVVAGDLELLSDLLSADPRLVYARSEREHGATLLHYISANGVENYRQRTPANIIDIARLLLDSGADVNAFADVYGGCGTLELVVTSAHPRAAGVQIPLAELLLARGAHVPRRIVRSCLVNGSPEAAAFMSGRVEAITLEEAAGLGFTDVALALYPSASEEERTAALLMACWYGQTATTEALLDAGLDVASVSADDGRTALHIASYVGDAGMARVLLSRGAPVNVRDREFGTPPVVWALHAWLAENRAADDYPDVITQLLEAGAEVKAEWIGDERLRAHPELFSALSRSAT